MRFTAAPEIILPGGNLTGKVFSRHIPSGQHIPLGTGFSWGIDGRFKLSTFVAIRFIPQIMKERNQYRPHPGIEGSGPGRQQHIYL